MTFPPAKFLQSKATTARNTYLALVLLLSAAASAGDQKVCALPDGSSFIFEGHRSGWLTPGLSAHDVFSSGKIADAFAYAYTIEYRTTNGTVAKLLPFNDDEPDCQNYGMQGGVIYASTDRAVFRFRTSNGYRGGSALVVSVDGGRSFSANRHPNTPDGESHNPQIQAEFQRFGYYRSRFRVDGGQYLVEITDPLNYNEFLLFKSGDAGKSWQGPQRSENASVFAAATVQQWRDQFAFDAWINKTFRATSEACRQRPGSGCAHETDVYWSAQWQACKQLHTGRECLQLLPEPAPRFAEQPAVPPQ